MAELTETLIRDAAEKYHAEKSTYPGVPVTWEQVNEALHEGSSGKTVDSLADLLRSKSS